MIKFEGHQIFNQNMFFVVLMLDGGCFVRLDSHVSNMFDAGIRTTLAQCLVSIV